MYSKNHSRKLPVFITPASATKKPTICVTAGRVRTFRRHFFFRNHLAHLAEFLPRTYARVLYTDMRITQGVRKYAYGRAVRRASLCEVNRTRLWGYKFCHIRQRAMGAARGRPAASFFLIPPRSRTMPLQSARTYIYINPMRPFSCGYVY